MTEKGEGFPYDLERLKQYSGVLTVSVVGLFVGNKTESATYKQIERLTFPVTISKKGNGLCCLKINVEKFLRDGIPQPQDFLLSRKKNYRRT